MRSRARINVFFFLLTSEVCVAIRRIHIRIISIINVQYCINMVIYYIFCWVHVDLSFWIVLLTNMHSICKGLRNDISMSHPLGCYQLKRARILYKVAIGTTLEICLAKALKKHSHSVIIIVSFHNSLLCATLWQIYFFLFFHEICGVVRYILHSD